MKKKIITITTLLLCGATLASCAPKRYEPTHSKNTTSKNSKNQTSEKSTKKAQDSKVDEALATIVDLNDPNWNAFVNIKTGTTYAEAKKYLEKTDAEIFNNGDNTKIVNIRTKIGTNMMTFEFQGDIEGDKKSSEEELVIRRKEFNLNDSPYEYELSSYEEMTKKFDSLKRGEKPKKVFDTLGLPYYMIFIYSNGGTKSDKYWYAGRIDMEYRVSDGPKKLGGFLRNEFTK